MIDDLDALKKIQEKMPKETKFEMVKKYFFGDVRYALQDGLPLSDLVKLNDNEKKEIKTELMKKLKKRDWRAIRGAGVLKIYEAKDSLIKTLNSFRSKIDSYYKIDVALSLWQICEYELSKKIIFDILNKNKSCITRAHAVYALRYFSDIESSKKIVELLSDKCDSVRDNAVRTALSKLGYEETAGEIHPWRMQVDSENSEIQFKCINDIKNALNVS